MAAISCCIRSPPYVVDPLVLVAVAEFVPVPEVVPEVLESPAPGGGPIGGGGSGIMPESCMVSLEDAVLLVLAEVLVPDVVPEALASLIPGGGGGGPALAAPFEPDCSRSVMKICRSVSIWAEEVSVELVLVAVVLAEVPIDDAVLAVVAVASVLSAELALLLDCRFIRNVFRSAMRAAVAESRLLAVVDVEVLVPSVLEADELGGGPGGGGGGPDIADVEPVVLVDERLVLA